MSNKANATANSSSATALTGIAIVERDTNGELLTWSYPGLENYQQTLVHNKCMLQGERIELDFTFSRSSSSWIYILSVVPKTFPNPSVTAFAVALVSTLFDPERYRFLLQQFVALYEETGSNARVLEGFLAVMVRSKFKEYADQKFDTRQSLIAAPLSAIVQCFPQDVSLLWSAMLCKMRVLVLCNSVERLLALTRAFPLFVWHRKNWDVVLPWIQNNEFELNDLRRRTHFVAGTNDYTLRSFTDLFDVIADVDNGVVSMVSRAAKEDLVKTSVQDKVNAQLNQAIQDQTDDQDVIMLLVSRTKEILNTLASMGSPLTLESIHSRQLQPSLERFLTSVAAAENKLSG